MCKVCRSGRGSKSLDRLHSPSGLAHLISLPLPFFSTTGRRHGQAGVVVRQPAPPPSITQRHHYSSYLQCLHPPHQPLPHAPHQTLRRECLVTRVSAPPNSFASDPSRRPPVCHHHRQLPLPSSALCLLLLLLPTPLLLLALSISATTSPSLRCLLLLPLLQPTAACPQPSLLLLSPGCHCCYLFLSSPAAAAVLLLISKSLLILPTPKLLLLSLATPIAVLLLLLTCCSSSSPNLAAVLF